MELKDEFDFQLAPHVQFFKEDEGKIFHAKRRGSIYIVTFNYTFLDFTSSSFKEEIVRNAIAEGRWLVLEDNQLH